MSNEKELWEIYKGLERLEREIADVRNTLNEYFTKEEQVILRYEASIGRNGTKLEEIGGENLKEYARACRKYLKFGEEIEDCLSKKMNQTSAVWVGTIPDILKEAGCEEMDLYITQKHLRNILSSPDKEKKSIVHHHDIEVQQLKQLPELLNKPLVIVTANSPETIVVILDAQDKWKNQLIVPIKQNGHAFYKENRVNANFILSVYGKERLEAYLERADAEERIIFMEKNISTNSGIKPLQLRQFLSTGTYIDMVQHLPENVNVSDEKMILKNEGLDSKKPIKKL